MTRPCTCAAADALGVASDMLLAYAAERDEAEMMLRLESWRAQALERRLAEALARLGEVTS